MGNYFFSDWLKPRWFLTCFGLLLLIPAIIFPISGHDWQRVALFTTSTICFLKLASRSGAQLFLLPFSARARCVGGGILFLGIFSALLSHHAGWAFVEVALLITCCCIGIAIAFERRDLGVKFDEILISLVVLLCAAKSMQFIAGATAAFTNGVGILDTTLLFEGFSNRRTYGHLQTFTLPLLAFPLLSKSISNRQKSCLIALLICWWVIAIAGGTRGTWLGMGAAGLALCFCGPSGRRWVGWQAATALVGCLFYWLIFSELSSYLGIQTLNPAGERLTTNLSAREIIWQQAVSMIETRPLLGFGPMQFADIANPIAAHPHQSVLQWASEWGIPSVLLLGWLVLKGLNATVSLIQSTVHSTEPANQLRICLFASLVGALAQSMVDGIIVMPYSQLWLCTVIGWLVGLHRWQPLASPVNKTYLRCSLAAMGGAVAFLGFVVASDAPLLTTNRQLYQSEFGGHFQPRFWMQGVIADTSAQQLLHDESPDKFFSKPK